LLHLVGINSFEYFTVFDERNDINAEGYLASLNACCSILQCAPIILYQFTLKKCLQRTASL